MLRDAFVVLGLVVAHPQDLRRGEAGQRAVAGQRDQPFEPDRLLDLGALRLGSLVVPEDRGADDLVCVVERHEAVHLTGQSDARGSAGLVFEAFEDRLGGAPPVLRVLLRPAGFRGRERVGGFLGGEHLAVRGDREALGGAGSDVDAEEHGHVSKVRNKLGSVGRARGILGGVVPRGQPPTSGQPGPTPGQPGPTRGVWQITRARHEISAKRSMGRVCRWGGRWGGRGGGGGGGSGGRGGGGETERQHHPQAVARPRPG